MYGIPIDEHEQQRNDKQHAKFLLLLDGRLHLAPIQHPQKILDIGTGSGIWATNMADKYPEAQVFEIEDAEEDWTFRKNSFDLIYGRELIVSIRDWPKLIKQSFDHIRPGGFLELAMTNPATRCDDGSRDLEHSYFAYSGKLFYEVTQKMGSPLDAMDQWEAQFAEAGFVDIQHFDLKVPMGPWAKDQRLKKIGLLELHNLNEGYEAYLLRGLTQVLGFSKEEATVMMAKGRSEFLNPRYHTYVHL
ncbi:uncharacterized protein Z518_08263 [Rhinocladiella mackenziei CBS 650.93]|uniref:Methyltransferase domain-containing protein n=1 Tax=Rhinocladiella mackenziei CBS 650.93 TaxID=1442369 RepID=A0A0D2FK13_9EURO|nr:uncharacterized protein Z518_08263 [Rhinocladiella mackenziei CBS 650.93]KIX02322.1 hypothetical protein Z518_08263 [Rhinocladiella mackenziei CBS 650.93]